MESWQFFTLLLTNIVINGAVALIAYRIGVYHKQKMDSMEAEVIQAIDTIRTKIEDPTTFSELGEAIVESLAGRVTNSLHGMWGATKAQLMNAEGVAPTKKLAVLDILLSRSKKKALQRNATVLFGEELGAQVEKDPIAVLQEYAMALQGQGVSEEEGLKMIDAKAKELGLNGPKETTEMPEVQAVDDSK